MTADSPAAGHGAADGQGAAAAARHGLAELAFCSLSRADEPTATHHQAQRDAATLELDLTDPAQRQFGDYELLEQVGEGGMGVVYRARQKSLDREVAVKLLAAGPWASAEFVARFEREARHAARMQHPNIVTVYEVGHVEGLHFFSMRLVEGRSLSALLKRGERFKPKAAALLLRTVAEAVAYAHSLGVLHLDLKPANVLLDRDGVPYITDFGLARRLSGTHALDNEEISGTPAYMAPELAEKHARAVTTATDIWGLGAILYELVTGTPPFRAANAEDTLGLVLQGKVRAPRRWNRRLPLDLQAIALKCLEKDAPRRYPSAHALADDLARFIDGRPVHARPLNGAQRTWRWMRREPKLALVACLAFGVLLAGLLSTFAQSRRAALNAEIATHTLWSSRATNAQREMAAGNAYPALENAVANLREMEAHGKHADAALERLRIGTVLANAPQLIDVIPIAGGKSDIRTLAISPDAQTIAVATDDRVVRLVAIASGKELWRVDTSNRSFGMRDIRNYSIGSLRFSADGRRLIAYTLNFDPGGAESTMQPHNLDTVMIDVAAGKVVAPPKAFADFVATDYADDGRYALLFDRHGGVQRWRTQPWAPAGVRREFEDNLAVSVGGVGIGPLLGEALLADHGRVMVMASNANLKFRSFDAASMRPLRELTFDSARGMGTAWALRHDGRQLAIGTVAGKIVLWDLDTGVATWLQPQLSGRIATLQFSADDSRLLALSNAPSEFGVFDPRSGALVAEPVKLSANLSPNVESGIGAEFGADADTLLTRHWEGGATLWRLPAPGFPLQPPVAVAPLMVGMGARFALSAHPRLRLMATADNGHVKLWRLRPPPLTHRIAAPMVADTLHYDGKHLVAVVGNQVGVFDMATKRNVGATLVLPQAPTFAGLDGGGTRLIAIAGRQLGCWYWRDGKPCWPAVTLPDSALRLGIAAHAPVLAVSTGSNDNGVFLEHVRLLDLVDGHQRGAALVLHGPLGTLRLSDDGQRLLAWGDAQSADALRNVLYVIDGATGKVLRRLVQSGDQGTQSIFDARFLADGSIWVSTNQPWNSINDFGGYLWHWTANGRFISQTRNDDWGGLLALPAARGIIEASRGRLIPAEGRPVALVAPAIQERVSAAAVSADGQLLALATVGGVALTDISHNQRLLPDLRLPLPYHDAVQQLAFAPDGSRLVGRTIGGRWFSWPLVVDKRPVAAIERSISLHDFTPRDAPPPALEAVALRQLRAADPGPAPRDSATQTTPVDAGWTPQVPDARYAVLDLDPIANVDPRAPMNHATRLPPQPQNLPTLPRGLQRYDGVDFLLGRAVQLSGQPQNMLDAEFPAASRPLDIGDRRVAAIDVLVMQYRPQRGALGSVQLRYAGGGERALDIESPRDTAAQWMDAPVAAATRRMGWLGSYAAELWVYGPSANAEATFLRTYVVRLVNPEPGRPVASIALGAPPAATPGLLFLGMTLEPDRPSEGVPGLASGMP